MKKIIIDTNVLVSFVTDRNIAQQAKAAQLFSAAADLKKEILCHQEVLAEFVYVLDAVYNVGKNEISSLLKDLAEMPGVEIVSEFHFDKVLQLWPSEISDYGDAVIASFGRKIRNGSVATFDRKFARELVRLGLPVLEDWK